MSFSDKILFTPGMPGADENPAPQNMDSSDEEFMEALCELLDIQGGQEKGDPIVVLPYGPVIYH